MDEYQLSSFIGKKVQIDRGGPESKKGVIVGLGLDYLVLYTKDEGYIYYYIEHIKSITLSNEDNAPYEEIVSEFQLLGPLPETLKEIITSKKYKLIQINRGGPEKVRGILAEIFENYVAIVSKEKVVLVVYAHIKNVSFPAETPEEINEGQQEEAAARRDDAKKQNKGKNQKTKK